MKTTQKLPKNYQNNPFYVATDGLDLLFKKAQSVGIALAIVSGLAVLASLPTYFTPGPQSSSQPTTHVGAGTGFNAPAEFWLGLGLIAILILVVIIVISIIIRGAVDYATAQLASGKTVTVGEALRGVFSNFWSYTWVVVIALVKTLLWTLLFIIPGIIMATRYSLTGVSFFDKKLHGGAASTHSAAITKNAWFTTFASQNLLNLITFGVIQPLLTPGTNAVLYRQLIKTDTKPKAHYLSYLTLIVPLILTILLGLGIFFMIWAFVNYANTAP